MFLKKVVFLIDRNYAQVLGRRVSSKVLLEHCYCYLIFSQKGQSGCISTNPASLLLHG